MDVSVVVGLVAGAAGALAAVVGVLVAYVGGRRAERIAVGSSQIAAHQTIADWQRDLREWASEAVGVLSRASYACALEDEGGHLSTTELWISRHELSALIDRGRFFLPNLPAPIGEGNPVAYRGWRHAALDPLVAAERVLGGAAGSGVYNDREAALVAMRREFVSSIQSILAPDRHNAWLAELLSQTGTARASDPTLGGLLPTDADVPTGADRLLSHEPHARFAKRYAHTAGTMPRALSIGEVVNISGVSSQTVRRSIGDGSLAAVKGADGRLQIREDALEAWLDIRRK